MNIYVASSWRNKEQEFVVRALRAVGFNVYDFKNPEPGNHGFHWSQIDPEWQAWTPGKYRNALLHPIATAGFENDMSALRACDICVLVLPSGRSAHIEAGFAQGAGKKVIVYIPEPVEPELMYLMCDDIVLTMNELIFSAQRFASELDQVQLSPKNLGGMPSRSPMS
jgi:nucleoside 2-deoxyribosyltransferase